MVDHLFVYGMLLSSVRHAVGERLRGEADLVGSATFQGRLFRVSWYPGVVDGEPGDVVHGEVWRLHDPDATFDWLDEFEGVTRTSGSVTQPDEYTRETRTVTGPAGPVDAWLYMYARDASDLVEVRSGRWSAVTPPGA